VGGPEPSQGRHQRSQHGNSNEGRSRRRMGSAGRQRRRGVRVERPWSAEHHPEHANHATSDQRRPGRWPREQQQDHYEQRCLWEPASPSQSTRQRLARPAFDGGAQPPALRARFPVSAG
jgi:hypothetical protein